MLELEASSPAIRPWGMATRFRFPGGARSPLAEIGRRRVFGEIAAGANVHRRLDVLMRLEHAEHADGDLSIASANLLDSLDATHARHLQVHQDQVGVKAGRHPFAAYFADCPAYEPELCIPCNLRGAPLTPIWSCSHLTVGEDAEQRGHMYARCRIGDQGEHRGCGLRRLPAGLHRPELCRQRLRCPGHRRDAAALGWQRAGEDRGAKPRERSARSTTMGPCRRGHDPHEVRHINRSKFATDQPKVLRRTDHSAPTLPGEGR